MVRSDGEEDLVPLDLLDTIKGDIDPPLSGSLHQKVGIAHLPDSADLLLMVVNDHHPGRHLEAGLESGKLVRHERPFCCRKNTTCRSFPRMLQGRCHKQDAKGEHQQPKGRYDKTQGNQTGLVSGINDCLSEA